MDHERAVFIPNLQNLTATLQKLRIASLWVIHLFIQQIFTRQWQELIKHGVNKQTDM